MADTQEIDTVRSARSKSMASVLAAAIEFPWVTNPSHEASLLICERGHYFNVPDGPQQNTVRKPDLPESSFEKARKILIDEPGKYTYFEGFVSNENGVNVHAWLVDNHTGAVFDPSNNMGGTYIGVPLKDANVSTGVPGPRIVGQVVDEQAVNDHVRQVQSEKFSDLVLETIHLMQHQVSGVAIQKASAELAGNGYGVSGMTR